VEVFNEIFFFDAILHVIRNVMVQWWTKETCVSPNKSEVTKKRLGPCKYDEKTIYFLIKVQIYISTSKFVDS
jgi:hypothetical protein